MVFLAYQNCMQVRGCPWWPRMAVAILFEALSGSVFADCYVLANDRYQVPAILLRAIAQQESGGRADAHHVNRDGSIDIGLMQINSRWLPVLARHGLREGDLWDPCVSILLAAWILRSNFNQRGYTIKALGAYNSSNPVQQEIYARQVLRRVSDLTVPAN